MFFDDYPRFFDTSKVFSGPDRLNLRYEALFAQHSDRFEDARVLDITSHDGRWSLAALRTGAAHVTGIEARGDAVDRARENLDHYGVDESSYRFITGDIFEILAQESFDVDVVMCLGFLYHTYRHTELLHRIRQIAPTWVLMDTTVLPGEPQPLVKVRVDRPENPAQAVLDPYAHGDGTVVGRPSIPAVFRMLEAYDFGVQEQYDWPALIADHPEVKGVDDYRKGSRASFWARSGVPTSVKPDLVTTSRATTPPTAKKRARAAATSPQQKPAPAAAEPAAATTKSAGPATTTGTPWRTRMNHALAALTGYELRRTSSDPAE